MRFTCLQQAMRLDEPEGPRKWHLEVIGYRIRFGRSCVEQLSPPLRHDLQNAHKVRYLAQQYEAAYIKIDTPVSWAIQSDTPNKGPYDVRTSRRLWAA